MPVRAALDRWAGGGTMGPMRCQRLRKICASTLQPKGLGGLEPKEKACVRGLLWKSWAGLVGLAGHTGKYFKARVVEDGLAGNPQYGHDNDDA